MAKSVEDTFFYRYVRFFGANEVGHHPADFGRPVAAFHEANLQRLQQWPACMLSTSTHDTKVAEDVRARLFALSEWPQRWETALRTWSAANRRFKTPVNDRAAPDANEEYLLYQILLGAWPLQEEEVDDVFRDRIKAYMRKALAESKANTNWSAPNEAWMKACDDFVEALLDRARAADFWKEFTPFAADIAWRGMNLSLAQVALKATVPGMPDFYQGTELWDLSLVDPDNRRPVDYAWRRDLLATLEKTPLAGLLAAWPDGRIKMHVIRSILRHRREHPALFSRGSYTPVAISGAGADRFVAFLRQEGADQLLVVALRHFGTEVTRDFGAICGDAVLALSATPAVWQDLFSPRQVAGRASELPVGLLLGGLPVGVFCAAPENAPG
jgi:(1->4)-alpha-D-glucan 1-alpha-D-glucosylmutase